MLNDFREWLSDNLRYILLGLAGILILVIAFFAIKLISGLGSPKKEPETELSTEVDTETETAAREQLQLEKNVPEVLGLIEKYYTARLNKDYETLASICEDFDEDKQAEIESADAAVENYTNFMTYSKPGLKDGEYVVYIYVEMKLTGIQTQVPSLLEKYVLPDVEGNLMIAETNRSTELLAYTQEMQTDDDVQALINDVNTAYQSAMEQDADLANFVAAQSAGTSTGETSTDDGSSDAGTTTATTGTMQATTVVNVRGDASTNGTLYGVLTEGQQVEVLENLDSGWSKIRYTTDGTTIEGYVMTQYLGSVQ